MALGKNHRNIKPKLKRELSLFELTMYGIGIILGAGIYALIGKAAGVAGPAVWMSFFIGAIIAALTGLTYAELGSMFPKEAAEYYYTKKAFKKPMISFIVGWMMMAVGIIASATVALGFGGYLSNFTGIGVVAGALMLIIACAFLNFWGIKQTVKANIIFTLIELAGLVIIILLAVPYFGTINYFETASGFSGIMAAAILIFFAYIGFEDIVNVAEETKNARRNIPLALIFSIAVSTILYMLVSIAAVSVVDWQVLGQSAAPLADVADAALPGSSIWLSIIALFATANTVLIIMLANSRIIYGMAEQKALPRFLSAIHSTRNTPYKAIFVTFLVTMIFAVSGNIRTIAELTDFGIFFIFIFINASLIIARYKYPNMKRRFKTPINIGKFPVLSFLGLIFCAYMMTHFNLFVLELGVAIILIGAISHYVMKKMKIIKV